MDYQEIIYQTGEGVATITLNRPDRMNAMTLRMGGELHHAVSQASADDAVRVIILTGAGRGFCAGADMARLSHNAGGGAREAEPMPNAGAIADGIDLPEGYHAKYAYLTTAPKPIIAAINGAAAGVGMLLTLYCDIRFAAEGAKFTTAFARRGLVAEYGMAWLMPRLIGPAKTLDLLYSARIILGVEAQQMGLVDYVYPAEDLMAEVRKYATTIASEISPRSTRVCKELVYRGLAQDIDAAVAHAQEETLAAGQSDDFREGIAAWQEKRTPNFTGR